MTPWDLPTALDVGEKPLAIHADFRDILEIIRTLEDPDEPEFIRWQVALALFYDEPVPAALQREAMEQLCWFLRCGQPEEQRPQPRRLDWQQDAVPILAGINKVAGCEVRALPYLHWWSFISFFNSIGEGQLSTIVAIRDKLRRGKKLEKWEQEFYRENRSAVDLQQKYSAEELAEQQRLKQLLGE